MAFITAKSVTAEKIKDIRKKLGMTQKEFAEFIGSSKPTVERWESSEAKISGPITTLIEILEREPEWPEKLRIPEKQLKLRLFYMYKDKICTLIDVDESARKVKIKNYADNTLFCAFGVNTTPGYKDYEEFIESRCFPRERDKMKLELDRLGIPFYDPILIIEKTEGRMAEDEFWIKIDR